MKHTTRFMLLAIAISIIFNCHASQIVTSSIYHELSVRKIINDDRLPTKPLLDLLGKLNVKHNGTLESIKAATQTNETQWLRPKGKERQECPEVFPAMQDQLAPCFKALGLIDEIAPSKQSYEHVIVLSNNMISTSRERLAYAHELSKKGITFNKLHLLGAQVTCVYTPQDINILFDAQNSDLPLKNDWKLPKELPTTEAAVFQFLYDQAKLTKQFLDIPMILYNIPNQTKADGSVTRASTRNQTIEWIKKNGIQGSTLWISSNPYIIYQDCVIRSCAPSSLEIETVGPQMKNSINPNQDCLDTIARIIYEESSRNSKVSSVN